MQCSEVVGEKMLIYKTKLTKKFSRNIKKKKKKANHQIQSMHWKEDILQGNIRENKARKTSTEDTTCVDSALGLGLDPHGAAFGPPVFTQELERSKPWACNRKQLGKERNITCCMPYSSQIVVIKSNQTGYIANISPIRIVNIAWILRNFLRRFSPEDYFCVSSHIRHTLILPTALAQPVLSGMLDIKKLSRFLRFFSDLFLR